MAASPPPASRTYADIARNLTEAGYSDAEAAAIQREIEFYADIGAAIKKHAGEALDTKPFEADMRHLLNTYVQADAATGLGDLGALSLTGLITQSGRRPRRNSTSSRTSEATDERDHRTG